MTIQLYLDNSYLKEFNAKILEIIEGRKIILDKTAFYPTSGGQQNDTGIIRCKNNEFKVINVTKSEDKIIHEVDTEGLNVDDEITCIIDWDRRYNHMKSHTAAHIVSAIIHKEMHALISGNQLYEKKFRVDFDLENFDKELFIKLVDKANVEIKKGKNVKSYYLPRDEALKIPGMVKLLGASSAKY